MYNLIQQFLFLAQQCSKCKQEKWKRINPCLPVLFWTLQPGPDSKDRQTKFEIDEMIPEVSLWPKSISLKALELNIFDSNPPAEKKEK